MEETNTVLSIKSTYPVSSCILCHLQAFQAESKRFRRVSVIRVPTAKLVSLAAVFWAVKQRSTQKKRLLTSELHSFPCIGQS